MMCMIHFWEQLCGVHGGERLLDSGVRPSLLTVPHEPHGEEGLGLGWCCCQGCGRRRCSIPGAARGWHCRYRWLRDDTEAPSENCPGVQAAPSALPITRLVDTAASGSCSKYQRFLTKSRLWRIQTIHNLFFCCARICDLRTRVSLVAGVLNVSVPPTAFPRLAGLSASLTHQFSTCGDDVFLQLCFGTRGEPYYLCVQHKGKLAASWAPRLSSQDHGGPGFVATSLALYKFFKKAIFFSCSLVFVWFLCSDGCVLVGCGVCWFLFFVGFPKSWPTIVDLSIWPSPFPNAHCHCL